MALEHDDRICFYKFLFSPTWSVAGISHTLEEKLENAKLQLVQKLLQRGITTGITLMLINYALDELDHALTLQHLEHIYQPTLVIHLLGLIESGSYFLNLEIEKMTKDKVLINPQKDVNISNKTDFGYCLDNCNQCGKKRLIAVNKITKNYLYLKCKFCK